VNGTTAHLVATRLSGDGGYDPGHVELHRERDLVAADVARIVSALAGADYDTIATYGPAGRDGAQWILERAMSDRYRLVDRWTPKPNDAGAKFRAACEVFLDLAGRDIVTGDLY
jgi:hypothetical protein